MSDWSTAGPVRHCLELEGNGLPCTCNNMWWAVKSQASPYLALNTAYSHYTLWLQNILSDCRTAGPRHHSDARHQSQAGPGDWTENKYQTLFPILTNLEKLNIILSRLCDILHWFKANLKLHWANCSQFFLCPTGGTEQSSVISIEIPQAWLLLWLLFNSSIWWPRQQCSWDERG